MDQRRLEPIREGAQLLGSAVASGPAHDHDAIGLIDKTGDFSDVRLARGEIGPWLQDCDAGDATFRLRRGDILRKRQVGDPTARIGGGDRLRRLLQGGDAFSIACSREATLSV
jgi:hypothetical protein